MLTSEAILPDRRDEDGNHGSGMTGSGIGRVHRVEQAEGTVTVFCDRGNAAIRFINDGIVRLKVFRAGRPDWRPTPAVAKVPDVYPSAEMRETEDFLLICCGSLQAVISKANFTLILLNGKGEVLFDGAEWSWQKKSVSLFARASTESRYYGLGEKTGFLDKKGEKYEMWNSDVYEPHAPDTEALYQSIPFLIHCLTGKLAYGVFLDNPGRTAFDMRSREDGYTIRAESGELDLYLIDGPDMKAVVSRYGELTGKPPMPPRWALGYQQSRYSYMNQEEVLELARTFRQKRIPCDVIYLDIHYMDEYRVFTWDPERFPDPKQMIGELARMGFRIVPIVDPGVKKDPEYPVYREGVEKGCFCRKLEGDLFIGNVWPGPSAFPDFTDDGASSWWGDLHRSYMELGISGIWNDMNEPSVFNETTKTMDLDVVHSNNGNPKTHEEWHNLYGMLMSKATYEGLARGLKGERPFVLTRAGYAGIQRYAAVWTGDNRSYWQHMEMSMPMVLNLGLSGVAFAGSDIGGFSHHASGELVARWTQMGALFPFCRNHSAIDTIRQEPWRFGEQIESVCRDAIGLRYRLMPYLYSLFYEAAVSGLPVIRPLVLEYPDDPHTYHLSDQFLLGESLLAAPVCRPGLRSRAVYLPQGIWFDYWTGQRHEGGRTVLADAPLERMPLFVKSGAIVPVSTVRQFVDEPTEGTAVQLRIFSGAPGISRFRLFEDDGRSFGYEKGEYRLREFIWEDGAEEASVTGIFLHNGYEQRGQELTIVVQAFAKPPVSVTACDRTDLQGWSYDADKREITLRLRSENVFKISIVRET